MAFVSGRHRAKSEGVRRGTQCVSRAPAEQTRERIVQIQQQHNHAVTIYGYDMGGELQGSPVTRLGPNRDEELEPHRCRSILQPARREVDERDPTRRSSASVCLEECDGRPKSSPSSSPNWLRRSRPTLWVRHTEGLIVRADGLFVG